MEIMGIKSVCCDAGVETRARSKIANNGDYLYVCLGCKKPADAYFQAKITKDDYEEYEKNKERLEALSKYKAINKYYFPDD